MLASNATCRQRLTNFQQHERIDGWLQPAVVYAVDAVQRTHDELNITGALLEIGVHHGKFYLALDQCRRDTEAGYAMDLYEAGQKLNLDKSGRGSLAAFKGHLKRWSRDPSATQIVSGDSTRLAHTEFARSVPPVRLFSLDGGHTAAHAASDLRFAERVVTNGGVVFVDDIFNPEWPGVIEGVAAYLHTTPSLSPFAFVGNKLLMTTISMKPEILRRYSAHMGRSPGCKKTGMCFGDKAWFGHAVHTRKRGRGEV